MGEKSIPSRRSLYHVPYYEHGRVAASERFCFSVLLGEGLPLRLCFQTAFHVDPDVVDKVCYHFPALLLGSKDQGERKWVLSDDE